ncbi:MAG: RNase adapter RapZ [Abitibacteriaceae bacterium]|nr:RNase adapter RapZ [Abditibacteriaceae bacterium]
MRQGNHSSKTKNQHTTPSPSQPSQPHPMQIIIITGLSGAGKALATRHFEDFGFFCVDNLPPALIPMFAELCSRGNVGRVAVVTDVRGDTFFEDLTDSNNLDDALEKLSANGFRYQILFLDADDDLLIQRFKETRRRHPLADQYPDLSEAIAAEREALTELRERADKIVNTSHVTPRELREEIKKTFLQQADAAQMLIRVESFGFKHGAPHDADLVFDLRFLPNPNYDRVIGHLDGNYEPVIDYVMREPVTQQFLQHFGSFIHFLVPQFEKEGKSYLTIALGCTGGRHRSVVMANWLAEELRSRSHRVSVNHRDLDRSASEARNFEGQPARRAIDNNQTGDGVAPQSAPSDQAPLNGQDNNGNHRATHDVEQVSKDQS